MIKLLNIYSDNMIFQRGKPIKFCGYCSKNSMICVEIFSGEKLLRQKKVSSEKNRWETELEAMEACRGLQIKISNGDESVTLSNVAVGDVWLCSGQSNIECDFNYCSGTEEYIGKFGNCDIRFLDMEQDINFSKNEELKNPKWISLNKENYMSLSVIGCIFGQYLAENINVPVGLIKNYRGGNSIVSFLSEENLKLCDRDGIFKEQLERERKEVKSAWSMIPTAFYNAMTAPIERFFIKGMLWYQGETDSAYERPIYYKELLKKLIEQYRAALNNLQLPVILVQLCPFEMEPFDFKVIREIQRKFADEVDNVYLIGTADMGPTGEAGEDPIHPKYKTPIGERCALAALANVYGKDIGEWSSSIIKSVSRKDEDLILQFDHCADGLTADGEARGFEVGCDSFFINGAKAEILDKDKIIIKGASNAKIIRYSYANLTPEQNWGGNVKNSIGMPMIPFVWEE